MSRKSPSRAFAIALTLAMAATPPVAQAGENAATSNERTAARLFSGRVEPDGARIAGLQIGLAPGWKTYWRNPGDSGIPPSFDWSGSANVSGVEVVFPNPELFDSYGMTTIGYSRDVTLPLRVESEDPAKPVTLRLSMRYGVCSDVCVPETARLTLAIPPGAEDGAALIAESLASAPKSGAETGLRVARCTMVGAGPERRFEGEFQLGGRFADPLLVVVEGPEGVWFSPAEVSRSGERVTASAEALLSDPDLWVDRGSLRVTLLDGSRNVEILGCGAGSTG